MRCLAGSALFAAAVACSSVEGRRQDVAAPLPAQPAMPHGSEGIRARPTPSLVLAQVASASALGSPAESPAVVVEREAQPYLQPLGDTTTHGKALATRYANLPSGTCRNELRRRHVAAVPAHGLALGIAAPMRIVGPLHGVRFVTPGPKSVHGMLDCRLVLLLDELSQVLAAQGVATVYVDGFYRPKAHLPGKKAPSQHAFGLAVDIHSLGTTDGRTFVIERDFAGRIGAPVCGPDALLEPASRDAVDLRNIVCAMAKTKAFHYLLTPNYDAAHVNHLHGDIKRGGKEHVLR